MARSRLDSGALAAMAVTFGAQTTISLGTLAAPIVMPAAAADVGVDPRWIGGFTALSYAVATAFSFLSAATVVRLGGIRSCQASLLMAAAGVACMTLAAPWAMMLGVMLCGGSLGPINGATAHILSRRVPRDWYSTAFTAKQTGVPVGFAVAGVALPALVLALGWRGGLLALAGAFLAAAVLLEFARKPLGDGPGHASGAGASPWGAMRFVLADPTLRPLALSGLLYVVAQHTFLAFAVVFLTSRQVGMDYAAAGALLAASQVGGALTRIGVGLWADALRERLTLVGAFGVVIALGAAGVALVAPSWPGWLIAAAVVFYGVFAVSWNGVSMGEFARFAPPGLAGPVTAASTAVVFSGAVIGPASFSAILRATDSYAVGFGLVALLVCAAGLWLLAVGRAHRRALGPVS